MKMAILWGQEDRLVRPLLPILQELLRSIPCHHTIIVIVNMWTLIQRK